MNLIQNKFKDPWKILASCIMLNRVSGSSASKIIDRFFKKYPTPEKFTQASFHEFFEIVGSLGMPKIRFKNLVNMTRDYLSGKPFDQMRGIGVYGRESWIVFVEGNINIVPKDKKLNDYVRCRNEGRSSRSI